MTHRIVARAPWLIFPLVALILVIGSVPVSPRAVREAQALDNPYTIYLPSVRKERVYPSVFGMNMTSVAPSRGLEQVRAAKTYWVRTGTSLLWKDVQPDESGDYNWNAPSIKALEQEMIAASQNNLRLIVIVHGSPSWATTPHPADCAPINPAKYAQFGQFLAAAVKRYKQPPFNIQYWEIGNEPDLMQLGENSPFGCWGDPGQPYYGGGAYGDMLNVVYPAIKGADPDAKVLNGGLLMEKNLPAMLDFFEGMLASGAGNSFDIVSYHSYSWDDQTNDGTLGKTDWKVAFLRETMASYGVPEKPLINTEGALLCPEACPERQANALVRWYSRALRDGLLGYMWYSFDTDSFYNSGLVEPSNPSQPRPAYLAYKHMVSMLDDMLFQGPVENQPASVEGYHFVRGSLRVTVVWSDAVQNVTLALPPGATAVECTDRAGSVVACSPQGSSLTLTVGPSPVYVKVY